MTTMRRAGMPYGTLDVCSNVIEGAALPLTRSGEPVLIVERGEVPGLWIAAPAGAGGDPSGLGQQARFIVEANVPRIPGVQVAVLDTTREVIVSVGDTTVLKCRATAEDVASIPLIDFRPLGLQLWGDEQCLYLGPMTMVRNRFRGTGIAFDF